MTAPKPPDPHLDEINARIAEAEERGNWREAEFARWQKQSGEPHSELRARRNGQGRAG